MLTFGFMEGDRTYAQEIKRLRGGQYIDSDGKLEVKEYFTLHHHPERFAGKCDEEIIEEMDMAITPCISTGIREGRRIRL
jgi:hypothetical protein